MLEINKIHCMDCLEGMKQIPDNSVDLVLTDPPYAMAGMNYKDYNDNDIQQVNNLICNFLQEAKRIAKIIIFPSGKYETEKMLFKLFPPKWRICWYKGAQKGLSPIGFNDWEMIMIYGNKVHVYAHDFIRLKKLDRMGNYGHPCPKPVEWARWFIKRFSKENDIVLDPFMGSGTTAVACKQLNRNFIGFEISQEYVDIANKRLAQENLKEWFDNGKD